MKRKSNQQPLKEVIEEYLAAFKLDSKLTELKLVGSWEKIMGRTIAKHTQEIYIKNKILYLKLNSSVLRNELSFGKEKIIQLMNQEVGAEVIVDVVLK
jgi:predicted nucleic acid-binding Zn ribbon protein